MQKKVTVTLSPAKEKPEQTTESQNLGPHRITGNLHQKTQMTVATLWIQQQDGERIPLLRIQAPRQLGGKPKTGNPLGAELNTEPRTVIFQGVSLTGNNDSLVTDGECRQDTAFYIRLCTHHEPFSQVRHVRGARRLRP